MKSRLFWKKILLMLLAMSAIGIAGHFYLLYMGPFDVSSEEYRNRFPGESIQQIKICKFCKVRISYGNGLRRWKFSIIVIDSKSKEKEVEVVYIVDESGKVKSVEFDEGNHESE